MSRVLNYDDWVEKEGYDYGEIIQNWLEKRPNGISLQTLGIYDLDDFIQDKILEAYEEYLSDFEDHEYERFKEEKCF